MDKESGKKSVRAVSLIRKDVDKKFKELSKLNNELTKLHNRVEASTARGDISDVSRAQTLLAYARSKRNATQLELSALRREEYGPWAPRSIDCTDGTDNGDDAA